MGNHQTNVVLHGYEQDADTCTGHSRGRWKRPESNRMRQWLQGVLEEKDDSLTNPNNTSHS